jgi:hypothetical protein
MATTFLKRIRKEVGRAGEGPVLLLDDKEGGRVYRSTEGMKTGRPKIASHKR